MHRLAALLFIGAVATGGAAVAYEVASQAASSAPGPTAAPAEPFDYNGKLSGLGYPWLRPMLVSEAGSAPAGLSPSACVPGWFKYVNANKTDAMELYFVPGIRLGADACPLDMKDVYLRVTATDPWLGGTPGRLLAAEEMTKLGSPPSAPIDWSSQCNKESFLCPAFNWLWDSQPGLKEKLAAQLATQYDGMYEGWYGEAGLPLVDPAPTPGASSSPLEVLLANYGLQHFYKLPYMDRLQYEDLVRSATPAEMPTAAPPPTASPTGETRKYRVTLSGWEDDPLVSMDFGKATGTATFEFKMTGQFVLRQTSKGWVFDSGAITSADVQVRLSYEPASCWETKPYQTYGFTRLRQATRLTGEVQGDVVQLVWGSFWPGVDAPSKLLQSCIKPGTGTEAWGSSYFESDQFFVFANGELLPMQDHFYQSYPHRDSSGHLYLEFTLTVDRLP